MASNIVVRLAPLICDLRGFGAYLDVLSRRHPPHLSEADQERVDNRTKPLSLQQTVEVNGIALWVGKGDGGGGGGGN